MNGSYSISEATANKVKQAMEELDYHPNAVARMFAKQSTKTVIFLATIEKNSGYSNPQLFEMICGLEQALSNKKYALLIKNISPDETPDYVENAMQCRICDGFVIHASVISKRLDSLFFEHEIPHIVIGTPNFKSHFCWIDIDNRLAGEMAITHLFRKGYQRPAYIGGKEDDNISNHRLEGIISVFEKHSVNFDERLIKRGESEPDNGYNSTLEILGKYNCVDSIICANNYITYGCVQALIERKVNIPGDIGVITFDDYPFSKVLRPQISVVDIDVFDVGVQAGKYILHKIKKPNTYVQSYITVPVLIERESTNKRETRLRKI